MKNKLTIKKGNFLEWYFNTGQDTEKAIMRLELANDIINKLFESDRATTSIDDIFEFANKDAIPLNYCNEYLNEDTEEYIFDRFASNYDLKII